MSLPKRGSRCPYGAWWMNRRTTSQLPVSPMAIRIPRTTATPGTRKRQGSCGGASPNSSGTVSDNVRRVADPRSKDTGSQGPRRRATRNASVPLIHRATVERAKTAKKRMALVPKMVQKTSKYPTVENHSQSTRKSLASPSAIRQATMTMIATAMPLHRISHLHPASPIVMTRRQGYHCQAQSGGSAYDPGPDIPVEIGDLAGRTIRHRLSARSQPACLYSILPDEGAKASIQA